MTRKSAREIAVMLIFRMTANPEIDVLDEFFDRDYYRTLSDEADVFEECPDEKQVEYIRRLTEGAVRRRAELDGYIGKYSKNWRPERISKTAAAVLRTAMYEVLYMDDVPDAAAMNEAIEISRYFDDQETVRFVNGILGGFYAGEVAGTAEPGEFGSVEESIATGDYIEEDEDYTQEDYTQEDFTVMQVTEVTFEPQAAEDEMQAQGGPDGR